MNHLMLDFETLGQQPDTAVISLGAVLFTRDKIIAEKLWLFDLMGQIEIGRRSVSGDTIIWWMRQDPGARQVFERLATQGILLKTFVPELIDFVSQLNDIRVWGNGATFDIAIIENILYRLQAKAPWKYYNQRCYRTMKQHFAFENKFEGTKHDALDDARHQAKCLMQYWQTTGASDK